jgi:hypothetical protein
MTRTVAVDFDGVIHDYNRGWSDGTIYGDPLPGSLEALRTLLEKYAVFVHTTRDPHQVGAWLYERGFDCVPDPGGFEFWNEQGAPLLITQRKLPAIAYIDDRAIRFESWAQALSDLERLT